MKGENWPWGACRDRKDESGKDIGKRRARRITEVAVTGTATCSGVGSYEFEKVACTPKDEQTNPELGCGYNDVELSKSKCGKFIGMDKPKWYTVIEKVKPKWNYIGSCGVEGSNRVLRDCTEVEIEAMKKASELECNYEFDEAICARLGEGNFKKLQKVLKSDADTVEGCVEAGLNMWATPRECTADELDFAQDTTGKYIMEGCGYENFLEGEKFCRKNGPEGEFLWFQKLSNKWIHEDRRAPNYFGMCARNGSEYVALGTCSDADTIKDDFIGCGYTFNEDERCLQRDGKWVIHKQLTGVKRNQAFAGPCYIQPAEDEESWVPFKTDMKTEPCDKPEVTPKNCGVTLDATKICGEPYTNYPKGYWQRITAYDGSKHLPGLNCPNTVGQYFLTEEDAGCTETDPKPDGFR